MLLSVILCTYNRADSLRRALESLCALKKPETRNLKPESEHSAFSSQPSGLFSWELLVVDNNSTDQTKQVCDEFASRLPLRYVSESRQGKSHALNRGVCESTGDVLVFTDDDVEVDANWLNAIWQAVQTHPEASFFGGRVIPKWETSPPEWITEYSQTFWLRGVLVHLDFGDKEVRLDDPEQAHMVFGANMIIRRKCFDAGIRFREDLGLTNGEPTRGEDTELVRTLLAGGHVGMHISAAVVHHHLPATRLTERYVREWYKGQGISEVRLGKVKTTAATIFGAPRYLWLKLLRNSCRYVSDRLTGSPAKWLPAEIEMARCWGWIFEFRRQAMSK